MNIKEHTTEQSVGQRRNKKNNKYLRQVKTINPHTKFVGCWESSSRGKFTEINAYVKEQEMYVNYVSIKK